MAKTKPSQKATPPVATVSGKVKNGRVTKPAEMTNAGSKDVKSNGKGKDAKKVAKVPAPPSPVSSEDSESESDVASDVSSEESASESDSEGDVPPSKKAKINGTTKSANGVLSKAVAQADSEEDETSEDDDDDEGSDSEDDESEEESEHSEEKPVQAQAKPGKTETAKSLSGAKVASASKNDEEDSASDDSSASETSEDGSESEVEAETNSAQVQKRKADTSEEPMAKKAKTSAAAETPSGAGAKKSLFIGNISWNVDEEWLTREFSEFGEVIGCRIVTDRATGRSKGYGYVDFTDGEDATKAHDAMKGRELDGRALNVDFATPKTDNATTPSRNDRVNSRANKFGDSQSNPSDTIFVGNLSFSATSEDMQQTFGDYGTIVRVSMPTDPESGGLKGFGYITFSSTDEAKAALEGANGMDIAGRACRLDFATPRVDRDGGSRGGFRGGRGGDRGAGGRGSFRGGRGDFRGGRGGRGGARGGRGGSFNRGGMGDFSGKKTTF